MRFSSTLGLRTRAALAAAVTAFPARVFPVALATVLLSSAVVVGSASADPITGGGIDQARGCSTVDCLGSETFQLDAAVDVEGTLTLDAGAMTLSFDFSLPSLTDLVLNETVGGTEDNGVAKVVFSDVQYLGTVSVFEAIPGTWIVMPASTASVAGDQSQFDDASGQVNAVPADFTAAAARVTGNCLLVGSALNCGLQFGTSGFELGIGDPPGQPAQTRFFQHTANIVALPEPTTLSMIGLALGFVALTGRRRA